MDTTLFIKNTDTDMIIVQIDVDDIIFGATNPSSLQGIWATYVGGVWDEHGRWT